MKKLFLITSLMLLVGCATDKANWVDRTFYDVETNDVPVVTVTPGGGLQTNLVPRITLEEDAAVTGAIGGLGAVPVPWAGIASTGLLLLLGAYREVRNGKVKRSLVTGIDAARAVILARKDGRALDKSVVATLRETQESAGTRKAVKNLLVNLAVSKFEKR